MASIHGEGPLAYRNWREVDSWGGRLATFEFPLYTDAYITGGSLPYGPYHLIRTNLLHERAPEKGRAAFRRRPLRPAITLRAPMPSHYEPHEITIPDWGQTRADIYHGGDLKDEIAALVSLCLGIRVWAGECTRRFEFGGDPLGEVMDWPPSLQPVLLLSSTNPLIPSLYVDARGLEQSQPIAALCGLQPVHASALVRAARLYQQAVWVADSQPHLSWLLLVSAVEVAGVCSRADDDPVERVRVSKKGGEILELLRARGQEGLFEPLAAITADLVGATKTFMSFHLHWLPAEPPNRPREWAQIAWTKGNLRRGLDAIYTHRSSTSCAVHC